MTSTSPTAPRVAFLLPLLALGVPMLGLALACADGDGMHEGAMHDDDAMHSEMHAEMHAEHMAVRHVNPRSPADGDQVAPFSGAVWVGSTLYLSGMLGLEGGQVPETAEAEATNVLNNIRGTLEDAGLTMDDLVVVQVYASDVGDYGAFNDVYRTYFTSEFPARAFLGSGPLLFGARFEVMGIAVGAP